MKITELPNQFNDFFEFNKKIFPERKNVPAYFQYFYQTNPLLPENKPVGYLALSDQNEITGQFLLSPVTWCNGEEQGRGYWGCDYYVSTDFRGSGAGAMLALKAIHGHKPYFTIGATEEAKKISLSLKAIQVGDLYKYIRVRNLTAPAKTILHKIFNTSPLPPSEKKWPDSIDLKEARFERTNKPFHTHCHFPALSFDRSQDYMDWRFLHSMFPYYIYRHNNRPDYFVCRSMIWRGLVMLVLVDYRTDTENPKGFSTLLRAVTKLATRLGVDGTMTFSSLSVYDKILEQGHFFRIGRPLPILTNLPQEWDENAMLNRRAVLATLADCDIDFNLGDA